MNKKFLYPVCLNDACQSICVVNGYDECKCPYEVEFCSICCTEDGAKCKDIKKLLGSDWRTELKVDETVFYPDKRCFDVGGTCSANGCSESRPCADDSDCTPNECILKVSCEQRHCHYEAKSNGSRCSRGNCYSGNCLIDACEALNQIRCECGDNPCEICCKGREEESECEKTDFSADGTDCPGGTCRNGNCEKNKTEEKNNTNFILLLSGICGGLFLIALVIAACCIYKQRMRRRRKIKELEDEYGSDISSEDSSSGDSSSEDSSDTSSEDSIDLSEIEE